MSADHAVELYPPTHFSKRGEAIYEQCPWDEEHVNALYPILGGRIVRDGDWHDYTTPAPDTGWVARYRVFEDRYFQVIVARPDSPLFEALSAMDAVETEDDAEWVLYWDSNQEMYAMTSTFAFSPGPFDHHARVDEWLWERGLGLEPYEFHVEGVAYLERIEASQMQDAMDRLIWLENAMMELDRRCERVGEEFWRELELESEQIGRQDEHFLTPDEVLPLPDTYRRQSHKQRIPLRPGTSPPE
jgi:hypothetical protein